MKFNGCFEVSLSHDLIIKLTTYNSRNLIFINSIISTMKKLLICKSTIAVILLLNNKQMSNIDEVIFNFLYDVYNMSEINEYLIRQFHKVRK